MKHKKLFVSLTAVLTVAVFLAIFLMIWFFGDRYKDFDEKFSQEFEIPGLEDGAVPQGMTTYTVATKVTGDDGKEETVQKRYFFVSAYMSDGSPSRIYVIGADKADGKTDDISHNYKTEGYVTLKTADGKDFYGHCGGIAINGSYLWVTGESKVNVAKASKDYSDAKKNVAQEIVEKAKRVKLNDTEGEYDFSVKFTTSFNANCRASFCYYFDDPRYSGLSYDRLYVGEFYRSGNYKTDEKHHVTTPNGYQNKAFMYEYNVSSANDYGLTLISGEGITDDTAVPQIQKIFSLPEQVQGMAWSGRSGYGATGSDEKNPAGTMVLSQSYGLANSKITCYDGKTLLASANRATYSSIAGESFEYDGVKRVIGGKEQPYTDKTLYVYYVDRNNEEMVLNDYSIPSMSEGLCAVTETTSGNVASKRVYVLFESGSKKYRPFVREKLTHVYSFIPREKQN